MVRKRHSILFKRWVRRLELDHENETVRRRSSQPIRDPFIMEEGEEPKVKVKEIQTEAHMK